MDFLSDDPFEEIVREFFGGNGRPKARQRRESIIGNEDEERVMDFMEDEDNLYLIFEIAGYNEEDVSINIKGRILEIIAEKKDVEGIREYLARKLSTGLRYKKTLQDFINIKNYTHTFKNGILEIKFEKK